MQDFREKRGTHRDVSRPMRATSETRRELDIQNERGVKVTWQNVD